MSHLLQDGTIAGFLEMRKSVGPDRYISYKEDIQHSRLQYACI